nr:hypothetical protein GCM10020063_078040 [Dactylosporangium thailandense]
MTAPLRDTLLRIGEQMPPARLPEDLWRRGRRERYRDRVLAGAGAAIAALLVGAVAVLPGLGRDTRPAAGVPAVPGQVELPYPWQQTVQGAPAGAASVLFGGGSALGTDPFESEGGKLAVVGRAGAYRVLRYPSDGVRAGIDVRLSPDGTRVAQPADEGGWLTVTDLRTGRARTFDTATHTCCGTVVAWRPDGEALLTRHRAAHGDSVQYHLLHLSTAAETPLGDPFDDTAAATSWSGAFAPDGGRVVVAQPTADGTTLDAYDAQGNRLWRHPISPGVRLAGAGAWTPDGTRIALLTLDGCAEACDTASLAARTWHVSYLDAATGADAAGPALPPLTGLAVRALGWHDTELVAVVSDPEPGDGALDAGFDDGGWAITGHVRVAVVAPGGVRTVLDPPPEVSSIDVAPDLVAAGAFGGPHTDAAVLPIRWAPLLQLGALLLIPIGGLALLTRWLVRRHRRQVTART